MEKSKLKKARETNELTQKNVSELLSIPLGTYRGYEQGKRNPNLNILKRLSILFKCSIEELI